jgi:hypothetical protein
LYQMERGDARSYTSTTAALTTGLRRVSRWKKCARARSALPSTSLGGGKETRTKRIDQPLDDLFLRVLFIV